MRDLLLFSTCVHFRTASVDSTFNVYVYHSSRAHAPIITSVEEMGWLCGAQRRNIYCAFVHLGVRSRDRVARSSCHGQESQHAIDALSNSLNAFDIDSSVHGVASVTVTPGEPDW